MQLMLGQGSLLLSALRNKSTCGGHILRGHTQMTLCFAEKQKLLYMYVHAKWMKFLIT